MGSRAGSSITHCHCYVGLVAQLMTLEPLEVRPESPRARTDLTFCREGVCRAALLAMSSAPLAQVDDGRVGIRKRAALFT